MKPVTIDDVFNYIAGNINEAERHRVEQARHDDPQVAGWFRLVDDETGGNDAEMADDEIDGESEASSEASEVLRADCKALAASRWMLAKVGGGPNSGESDPAALPHLAICIAGTEWSVDFDASSIAVSGPAAAVAAEPQSLLILRPSDNSAVQKLPDNASQDDIRALDGWAADIVPLMATAVPERFRGWFRSPEIREALLDALANRDGAALMVRMLPQEALAPEGFSKTPPIAELHDRPEEAQAIQARRGSPEPNWLDAALAAAGLVESEDARSALHVAERDESRRRRYPVRLAEIHMQNPGYMGASATCKVKGDWLATRLIRKSRSLVGESAAGAAAPGGTALDNQSVSLENRIEAARLGRYRHEETSNFIAREGLRAEFTERCSDARESRGEGRLLARLTIDSRGPQFKHALIGCAFLEQKEMRVLERAFVVLRAMKNTDWLVGEVDFDRHALYGSVFGGDNKSPVEIVVCPIDVADLSDDDHEALLKSIDRDRANRDAWGAWRAWLERQSDAAPSSAASRELLSAVRLRLT